MSYKTYCKVCGEKVTLKFEDLSYVCDECIQVSKKDITYTKIKRLEEYTAQELMDEIARRNKM